MSKQQTLAAPLRVTGQGLHTGVLTEAEVRPAPVNTGIIFVRDDLEGAPVPRTCSTPRGAPPS